MTALLLLLLGLAAAGTPPPATPAEGGPWIVVQKDGTRVTFDSPPRASGGRLVGTLRGSGTLVSVPEARVDREATAKANAPGAVLAPAPKAVATPRPFETPPLGDRAKLTRSAEEAQRLLEGTRAGTGTASPSPPASPSPASPGEAVRVPAESAPVDRMGRGEEYWRERAGALRSELVQAERELAQAEADLESAERAYLGRSEAERTTFVVQLLEARDRAARARREHGESSVRWQALEEEARKAGAFPGWLR
ncbi:MAG: hypothetical protein U0529_07270 [Thermoanaerobaculia bacterium]